MNLDFLLFQQINNFAGKYLWLDTTAVFFGKYFGFILILILIFLLFKDSQKYSQMVLQSFFGAILAKEIFVDIIQQIFQRPRPFIENQIYSLIDYQATPAFPSAHAAFYFAIATIAYLHDKKAGPLFVLSGFLIATSRVFSGVHWPSDILAGATIGILSGLIVNKAAKEFLE